VKFITREVHNGMLKRSQLKKDDLVFTITGRIGSVAIVPDNFEGNINQHSVRFQLKTQIANIVTNPRYVAVFLNLSLGQFLAIREVTGGTRPALDYKALYSLRIILPPTNIQNHIVSIMRSAYAQKKQKEQEADALLDSIDDYVLTELGIEKLQHKENSIESRIFTATLSEVSGRRFDPEVHYQVYSLHTKLYPMERFQDCVLINPLTSYEGYELETSVTFVPMEKVSAKYGEADLSLYKMVEEAKGYTRFRDSDLIWAKITPCMENGKSAVVDNLKGGIGCGSTEFHVFRALDRINIHYIHALLRLKSLREHATLHFTGSAGQQRVSNEFFKDLIIPKPSIEKQTEIADYITNARNRAKQLQQEADTIVEQVKERIERILLTEA
jgi:restriction endonuclease S subunit